MFSVHLISSQITLDIYAAFCYNRNKKQKGGIALHYDTVQNYAMKCRLYPTKAQKQSIDDALHGLAVFHNCLVYDMWHNGKNVTEKQKKAKDGIESDEKVHFPNIRAALTKEYKDQLLKEHPIIEKCPQAAITTNVGLKADLQKEFGRLPIECQKPKYYNDLHPRLSYTYQESISKIQPGENVKAFWINLSKLGPVKVRGWNPKLRFGNDEEELDFLAWARQADPKTMLTVTVSRDKVGDYFIVFKIKVCRKPFAPCPPPEAAVGVDVGIKDLAICSDGTKFANPKFKKKQKRLQRLVNRKMARRWGPANEEFREVQKKNRAEWKKYHECVENGVPVDGPPKRIQESAGYRKARRQHAKLNRKISRQRDNYNHSISRKILSENAVVAVESLSIKNMVRNKHLSYALTDAAFGNLLLDIQYKGQWHNRSVLQIDQWSPSSKRCFNCGYIYNSKDQFHLPPWTLSIRNWVCPCCGAHHDRDINAAKNILYYASSHEAI